MQRASTLVSVSVSDVRPFRFEPDRKVRHGLMLKEFIDINPKLRFFFAQVRPDFIYNKSVCINVKLIARPQ